MKRIAPEEFPLGNTCNADRTVFRLLEGKGEMLEIIVSSLTRSLGFCGPERHGVIFLRVTGIGKILTDAFVVGVINTSGSNYWMYGEDHVKEKPCIVCSPVVIATEQTV